MKNYFLLLFLLIATVFVGCQKEPVPVPSDIISISLDQDTLNYGNAETTVLKVILSQYKADTKVKITITGGTIDNTNSAEYPVTAYQSSSDPSKYLGIVERILVPNSTIGNYTITAELVGSIYSAKKHYTIVNSPVSNVLTLQLVNSASIQADNNSIYTLEATLQNHQAAEITLTTNQGKFVENGQQEIIVPVIGGFASADVYIGQEVTTYYLTASVANPAYTKSISFIPQQSLPDFIYLTSNSFVIDSSAVSEASSTLNFTAHLSKNSGKVSVNYPLSAEAFQLPSGIKTTYGTFYNYPFLSNQSETVLVNYFASPGLDKNLPLYVVFSANGTSGIISDTVVLDVN